ncbi:MAG: hypothetical protein IJ034_04670 [Mailhella sp.]|nr:hypothetical protein [Mailhella sp.]
MKKILMPGALSLSLLLPNLALDTAFADTDGVPAEKSFSQSVKDGYHSLKNSMFSSYSGNNNEDPKTYMENYRKDLNDYHDALREARDDYRKARLDEQRSYLEHHSTLPVNEDIDSDLSNANR